MPFLHGNSKLLAGPKEKSKLSDAQKGNYFLQ